MTSLFFTCVANTETPAGVFSKCTVQYTGVKATFAPALVPTDTEATVVCFPSSLTRLKQLDVEMVQSMFPNRGPVADRGRCNTYGVWKVLLGRVVLILPRRIAAHCIEES